jgi:hypothetical protein
LLISSKKRCYGITALILIAGWSSAAVVYMKAGRTAENPFEEFENSKRFLNSVERMGGKTALVANDLSKWFSGLWQGEQLAVTLVIVTIMIAFCYYFIASNIAADLKNK